MEDKKNGKKNRPTVEELEREVEREVERRKSKLECGCKAHTKDKKSCKRLSKVKSQPPVVRRSKKVLRVSQPPVKKVVGVVKPTMSTISNDQRREVNLYLPSSSNQSSSYAVAASPTPSLIDLVSPSPQWSRQSDNESVSSDTSYSNGMHTSGDDTDNEIELPPINMEVDPVPSVEYVPLEEPVPSVEVIPQEDSVDSVEPVAMEAIVEQVASLQSLPVPNRGRIG